MIFISPYSMEVLHIYIIKYIIRPSEMVYVSFV